MDAEKTILAVVVPCYNEEEVIDEALMKLVVALKELVLKKKIDEHSRVYFVDDGSIDRTWEKIEETVLRERYVVGVKLSRNNGHQNALLAGLECAESDIYISIDADLQDDVSAIEKMIDEYHNGSEIVYGVRTIRDTDTFFKRFTAETFYKTLSMLGVESIYNHADYRLISRKVLNCLRQYKEFNLYLRGIIPLIGFKSSIVKYERGERFAGETKYPLRKMIALALNAITSFSVFPIRMIAVIGILICFLSIIGSVWVLFSRFVLEQTVSGWSSIVLSIFFLGGVQMLAIGIIGEYVGKIYLEAKGRPKFFIEKIIKS